MSENTDIELAIDKPMNPGSDKAETESQRVKRKMDEWIKFQQEKNRNLAKTGNSKNKR